MNKLLSQFAADESGAGAVEYALVLLVAVSIVTVVSTNLKTTVSGLVSSIGSKLSTSVNNIS